MGDMISIRFLFSGIDTYLDVYGVHGVRSDRISHSLGVIYCDYKHGLDAIAICRPLCSLSLCAHGLQLMHRNELLGSRSYTQRALTGLIAAFVRSSMLALCKIGLSSSSSSSSSSTGELFSLKVVVPTNALCEPCQPPKVSPPNDNPENEWSMAAVYGSWRGEEKAGCVLDVVDGAIDRERLEV